MVYGGPQAPSGASLRGQEDYGSHHRDPAHVIFMGSMSRPCVGFSFLPRWVGKKGPMPGTARNTG